MKYVRKTQRKKGQKKMKGGAPSDIRKEAGKSYGDIIKQVAMKKKAGKL